MKKKCLLIFFILLNSIYCLAGDVTIDRVLTYANDNKSSVVIHYSGTTNLRFFVLDSSDGIFVLDLPGVFNDFDFTSLAFGQVRRVEQVPLDPDESKGLSIRFYLADNIEYTVFEDGPGTLTLFFEGVNGAPEAVDPVAQGPLAPIGMDGSPMRVLEGSAGEKRLSRIALDVSEDQGLIYLTGDGLADYRTFSLNAPERFVVDLKDTVLSLPKNELLLELPLIQRIRIRQFQTLPTPITRLVLDLSGEAHINVTPIHNGLVLAFAADLTRLASLLENRDQRTAVLVPSSQAEAPMTADQTPDANMEKQQPAADIEAAQSETYDSVASLEPEVNSQNQDEAISLNDGAATPENGDASAVTPRQEAVATAESELPVEIVVDDGPVVLTVEPEAVPEEMLPEQEQVDLGRGSTEEDGMNQMAEAPSESQENASLEKSSAASTEDPVGATNTVAHKEQDQEEVNAEQPDVLAKSETEPDSLEVTDVTGVETDGLETSRQEESRLARQNMAIGEGQEVNGEELADFQPSMDSPEPRLAENTEETEAQVLESAERVEDLQAEADSTDPIRKPEVGLEPGATGEDVAFPVQAEETMAPVSAQKGLLLDEDDPSIVFPSEKKGGEVFEAYVLDDGQEDPLDLFRESLKQSKAADKSNFEMASDIDMELAAFTSEKLPRTFFEMMKGVPSNRRKAGRVVVTNRTISLKETADMQEQTTEELDDEGHELNREELENLFEGDSEFDTFASKEYRGFEIAIIDVRDQPVLDLLRFIADQVGINLYVDPSVKDTRATYRFRNMPWDQVLDIILTNASLAKEFKNGVLRVATIDKFKREAREIASLREERENSVPTETVYRTLNYAKVRDAEPLVSEYLSARGTLLTDLRTNTLIISDIPKKLLDIRNLLTRLDVMIAQVSIEARIVETNTRFLRELGIQWGLGAEYTPEIGNDTGLTFPNRVGIGGPRIGQAAGAGTGPSGGYAVSFPVASENPAGIGLTLGNFLDNFKLEISLQLLESDGHGKIISSPKITTQNNKAAVISNGEKIPIQAFDRGTIAIKYIDAALRLQVTPQITSDETIIMDILVEKSEADFSRTVGNNPTIKTSSAVTQVLVKNGGTAVIGGIFTVNEQAFTNGVPVLKNIPIIKRLFGHEAKTYANQELLIFVTPRIVKY